MQNNSQQFKLLLTLKLRQLHSNGLQGICYDDLYRMFTTHVWKHNKPSHLSELADDVLKITDEDVVRWLATESKIQGFKSSLEDYKRLIDDEEL
ncbi:DNA-binding protein [Erysipelothrix sp. HDW6C]|uniref:post-transcriptional regulator n=1 Tax=Erysipelothrix sp. HDW6C TaxID=2714930 RepID=UPI00140A6327|nr:post-transcriptional regulator [Erysipelothrix sp. HDW6C]QIK70370.1 DNA-binding protein [Erysipelothrix sp. HDW6C]